MVYDPLVGEKRQDEDRPFGEGELLDDFAEDDVAAISPDELALFQKEVLLSIFNLWQISTQTVEDTEKLLKELAGVNAKVEKMLGVVDAAVSDLTQTQSKWPMIMGAANVLFGIINMCMVGVIIYAIFFLG